jgi:uncharacterized protein YndB with AHSA1/START domain
MSEWTYEFTSTVPGTPARVFAAWTDPVQLRRWFAEHADVEGREGGAFRFWGRYTYGVPDAGAARQRITRFEPDSAFGFEWPFDGAPSQVTLSIAASDPKDGVPATKVDVTHVFPSKPAVPYGEELVDDLWRLTLGNLGAHLRGGDGVVRPDYTDPNPEIRLSIVIDAPRARVFRALVEPALLNRWFATKAQVDPRVGGIYSMGQEYEVGGRTAIFGPSRILEIVPNERLVLDWLDWRGDVTRPPSRIAWTLESVGAKTKVTFVHDGFSRTVDMSDYPFGWGYFLGKLRDTAESLDCQDSKGEGLG